MRHYFTFRLKGSTFEKTVAADAHLYPFPHPYVIAAQVVALACEQLGGVSPDRLELVR